MRHRILKSLMVAGVAISSLGALAGAAAAETDLSASGAEPRATWKRDYGVWDSVPDKGGVDIMDKVYKGSGPGTEAVSGHFEAYDEKLNIRDYHKNGRRGIVKVWVGGGGPAVYYAHNGDDARFRVVDMSYAEGQSIQLKVCTSDSSKAVCTDKVTYTGIT